MSTELVMEQRSKSEEYFNPYHTQLIREKHITALGLTNVDYDSDEEEIIVIPKQKEQTDEQDELQDHQYNPEAEARNFFFLTETQPPPTQGGKVEPTEDHRSEPHDDGVSRASRIYMLRDSIEVDKRFKGYDVEEMWRQQTFDWPIHTIESGGGVRCIIRGPPSAMPEVKRGLTIDTKNIPDPESLPPLPEMEFEGEKRQNMNLTLLKWDHPFIRRPKKLPTFLIDIPVSAAPYNDLIQQVLVLYTTDRKEWKYTEGKLTTLQPPYHEFNFVEIEFNEPFLEILYFVRARYREDVKYINNGEEEIKSSMEPGVKLLIQDGVFQERSKVRLKIEPLDMNETDLGLLIPSPIATRTVAVSPIVKVTSSKVMVKPVTLIVPKPGHTVYGSNKMGLRCAVEDIRNAKVRLMMKTSKKQEITRFHESAILDTEFAKEFRFEFAVEKPRGSCYCLLVLEGIEPSVPSLIARPEDHEFMSEWFMNQLSLKVSGDELRVRALGRQLLNITVTDSIVKKYNQELELAAYRILKKWHNQNMKSDQTHLAKRLICALRDSNLQTVADFVEEENEKYLDEKEEKIINTTFEEISRCPAVSLGWKFIGRQMGISEASLTGMDQRLPSLQSKCYRTLRLGLEKLEGIPYREVFCHFITLLKSNGCLRITENLERRYQDKFRTLKKKTEKKRYVITS